MAYMMVIAKQPPHNATKGAKVFTSGKLPKLPEFVKLLHIFITADFKIVSYALYEVEDDKYFEGMKAINNRYVPYFEVEGYEYKLIPMLEMKDALSMVGLG
ncbi:MAG: hypothetical protein ACFFD5_10265 [Candidatus Thorarchaeota archaeon]